MRIALAQLDLLIGDIDGACAQIRQAVAVAAKQGADLVVCPELAAFGGYPPRDLVERRWLVERQWAALTALAETVALPTIVGCIEPLAGAARPALANALAVLDRGVVATYRKRLLPTYDVFDERRWFRPGEVASVIEIRGRRVGLTVCEDIWPSADSGVDYGVDPVAELIGRCDLIVNASASPFHVAKPALRRRMLADVARRAGCPLVYCNLVGAQDELLFDGDSCIVASDGALIARAPRWTTAVTVADLADRVADVALDDIDDLWTGLVAGIRGYCAKTRQGRVVLGLSGGIDSALVATLAVDALGAANVTGLLMPGPYSSRGSIDDAVALATNLGIAHHTLPIGDGFDAALRTLQPIFAGTPSGVAEENLQSRLRGTLVMAVANKLNAMALTTGNKSELACGYCTIYGDMNGGLAPIGDVYKTDVWRLSRHANRDRERIPDASITKAPSAELRENQTDQDSLPPYHVLDRILRRYVEESASPAAIVAAGEDPDLVAKIVRLVEVSEFKRRQAAPALRVSRKAFGIGRRMPIARAIG
ncbi:MAG TPA: NAD+ synthase [Planctomycetota bacterium]|nr:NAD+ synthase [Planctomycetota bacterium]